MNYIEVSITLDDNGVFRDMLIDTLGNEGPYESFVETPNGLKAYVAESEFDAGYLAATAQAFPIPIQYKVQKMEDRDWNAEWEANHDAVLVRYERKVVSDNDGKQSESNQSGSIWVRAPFHPHRTDVDYEIIIEPKMSFGTAHHPTTYMMLSYVAELDMMGQTVLDMGCGTAVLGILAKKRGASRVDGYDIDEWAYRNAIENASTNHVEINLKLGDASSLPTSTYDIIIANINRNILLNDMASYAKALKHDGRLLLSGFYENDEGALISCANKFGLTLQSKKTREGWSALDLKMK